jgi:hypothetical protein
VEEKKIQIHPCHSETIARGYINIIFKVAVNIIETM